MCERSCKDGRWFAFLRNKTLFRCDELTSLFLRTCPLKTCQFYYIQLKFSLMKLVLQELKRSCGTHVQIPGRLFAVRHAVVCVNWQQASVTGSKAYKAAQIAGQLNAVLA